MIYGVVIVKGLYPLKIISAYQSFIMKEFDLMFNRIRIFKRNMANRNKIFVAYKYDSQEYSKWQYNNPNVMTKNALEARILRQTHVIEKGMSLSHPREKFGIQKVIELLDYISGYCDHGFSIEDSIPVKNALGVIDAYLLFHKERGFVPTDIIKMYEPYKKFMPTNGEPYGIEETSLEKLQNMTHGEFPEFFCSRHSVRQFTDKKVSLVDIQKAVALAMHAPSACNRQSVKVYFYEDKETNEAIGELIAGNTGFDKEVPHYLVLTSDLSAFYDAFERNQIYVDGGIFSMALVEALHYYGIASCILQNGEFRERNLEFKKICGNIPENEKIILFIAIGYYKENVVYATSHRKQLDSVLIVK